MYLGDESPSSVPSSSHGSAAGTGRWFCLLGRPGTSDRAPSFPPRKGLWLSCSSHGKAWKPPRAPTPRPVYWRLAWAVLGTGSWALCPAAPPLSPRAGLPSLSSDGDQPSHTSSFSAVLSGKSGTSLPLQLSVSTVPLGPPRAGAASALLGGRGVPPIGVYLHFPGDSKLWVPPHHLRRPGFSGGKPEIVPSLPRGRGQLGSQGGTPGSQEQPAGGKAGLALRGCQLLPPAG